MAVILKKLSKPRDIKQVTNKITLIRRKALIDIDNPPKTGDRLRYSMSNVTQGEHRFYTLTMP